MSVSLIKNTPAPQSGYTPCACQDCMDDTVSSDVTKPELCEACAEAGCVVHDGPESTVFHPGMECQRDEPWSAF